jgi:hypothetical protein
VDTAWIAWVGGTATVLGLVLTVNQIIKTILRPLVRWIAALEKFFPVMLDIAEKYAAPEGGGEVLSKELHALAQGQSAIASAQVATVTKLDEVRVKLDELHDYSHTMRHDIIGDVATLGIALDGASTVADALLATVSELKQVKQILARGLDDDPPA